MPSNPDDEQTLLWGCAAIAKAIGRDYEATQHLLSSGQLPARKLHKRWVADKRKLHAYLSGEDVTTNWAEPLESEEA